MKTPLGKRIVKTMDKAERLTLEFVKTAKEVRDILKDARDMLMEQRNDKEDKT